jgi:hypothetical protein
LLFERTFLGRGNKIISMEMGKGEQPTTKIVNIHCNELKLYPFLSAIYLDLVSYLMEPTGTGQVMLPVQSVPP